MKVNGRCFCEAVQFDVEAASKWCAHCHCSMCRRAHGAGFVTWVGYHEKDVTISDSENTLAWFKSSAEAQRGFCNRCGSMMFFRSSKWSGELHVTRASIAGEVDRDPQRHSFFDTHVDWVTLGDDLPR